MNRRGSERVFRAGLQIDHGLDEFVATELLDPLSIPVANFWDGVAAMIERFGPEHQKLLQRREAFQEMLDDWHRKHDGSGDLAEYEDFLRRSGYIEADVPEFDVDVSDVDLELASLAGPQLVVPLSNPRYALNAANARWGSLYDALYGTDAISTKGGAERGANYNRTRGDRVIAYTNDFLDKVVPLAAGRHADVVDYEVSEGPPHFLMVTLSHGAVTTLAEPTQFVGFLHHPPAETIFLQNHGLHIQLLVDRSHPIGHQHHAGISDVILEAAVTTIQDCEDSVAAVDSEDKVHIYRNWLGLMRGDLAATFEKTGATVNRSLQQQLTFTRSNGSTSTLPGNSLMLVRNVGLHMMTDAVLTPDGHEIPEGMLDAAITVAAAAHNLQGMGTYRNSRSGSVYVVKPKLHGSKEVALSVEIFAAVERILGLPDNTVKIGIMDEERRTSLNLGACIAAARRRVIFINTGFLDRTGDEIHTARLAPPVMPKTHMRSAPWLAAYELRNVGVGLRAGFAGRAQIGKGMWAMPDEMAEMLATKIAHPEAGASCAWVPSPTAAVLHATHYHVVDVQARQEKLAHQPVTEIRKLLEIPLLDSRLEEVQIREELANNAQGILGYVVRWIQQGIGCSKVPDLHGVALMEDRATLRISSQHISNWLHHGIIDRSLVGDTFVRMAAVVDEQNADDPDYHPMSNNLGDSPAFQAALQLVFDGFSAPSGYTEPVLHRWRRHVKSEAETTM